MKIAVIGSRGLKVDDLEDYLPPDTTEIISGGAKGIDTCAREYANRCGIKLTEIRPDYRRYGKGAPLRRNIDIIELADRVIAFWDGKSHGTAYVIEHAKKMEKPITVFTIPPVSDSESSSDFGTAPAM